MFFKRRNKDKAEPAGTPDLKKNDVGGEGAAAAPPHTPSRLSVEKLRRTVDADGLGFKTTADLDPADGPIGQERAVSAIDFGLRMRAADFNLFVAGPPGSGKRTAVRAQIAKIAQTSTAPPDWIYVTAFADLRRLRAIKLPPGRAAALAHGLSLAVGELRATLPAAFEAEDYQTRRRAIDEEFHGTQQDAIEAVYAKAGQQNIAVLRTPLGYGMAPTHDGKVVKPEVFNQLPQAMRQDVETRIGALQSELEAILASAPASDKERRRQVAALNAETAQHTIEAALDDVSQAFSDVPDVTRWLAEAERDLIANLDRFIGDTARSAADGRDTPLGSADPYARYLATVVVSHEKDGGAPLVELVAPSAADLTGHVDQDLLSIRPGALHKANGGTLVLDAKLAADAPDAWRDLMRAIRTRAIRMTAPHLDPEPIPLDIKVVVLGTRAHYQALANADPDFSRLFKARAVFDDALARTVESEARFARVIAFMVKTHGLKPINAGGVARLIEEAIRIAGHRDRLTLHLGTISNILREADFWSRHAGRDVTTADDVKRAIAERARRESGLIEAPSLELEARDSATDLPGRVIALGLAGADGDDPSGWPSWVTARIRGGRGGARGIARRARFDGPALTAGAPLLRAYLSDTFGQDIPLAFSATLVDATFSANDSDDAALAHLAALFSALSGVPLRTDLAVAGSITPWGAVEAVSHINTRIESFFDVCSARGLTGTAGVIVPEVNVANLMLREDIVDAVRDGRFAVHAAATVDDALKLLTGKDAGTRSADGAFGADTIHGRVAAKLKGLADNDRTQRGHKTPSDAKSTEKRA